MKKEISYNFMQRLKKDLKNPDVLIEIIEDLEEQIERLHKEEQDTIHIYQQIPVYKEYKKESEVK